MDGGVNGKSGACWPGIGGKGRGFSRGMHLVCAAGMNRVCAAGFHQLHILQRRNFVE